MTGRQLPPAFVLAVFRDLQRRQHGVGPEDLLALRSALRAGFGLASDRDLVELCVTLWAKSAQEATTVRELFARHLTTPWDTGQVTGPSGDRPRTPGDGAPHDAAHVAPAPVPVAVPPGPAEPGRGVTPLPPLADASRQVVHAPQYPLTRRAVAQAFRRLRRPVPSGPRTQLDVAATIAERARTGVVTAPVLVARRRNQARLLLLVDRMGSMAPFHPYLDHLRGAIVADGGLERVRQAFFHDIPVDRADPRLVRRLTGLFPELDPVLAAVRASLDGLVFTDPALLDPLPLTDVVAAAGPGSGVVVISDAGATRGHLDPPRNLASIAMVRALHDAGHRVVWLNPVPREGWAGSSAAQLARHVPMLPLDRFGLHRAVDVLRGRPFPLERAA